MSREHSHEQGHPGAGVVQAFLDGGLSRSEHARVRAHLDGCPRCASVVASWRALFSELEVLPLLGPHEGFPDRVMAGVRMPRPLSLAARLRSAVGAWLPGEASSGHVPPERLQDFTEGLLPARHAARVQAHLDGCGSCSKDVLSWRAVLGSLEDVGHLAPSETFAARVMARVETTAVAPSTAGAAWWRASLTTVAGRAASLVPHTRQAWATLSGVAVAPMATLALVLYSVFSHPTLTLGALLSFAEWKVASLGTLAWQALSTSLLESAGAFRAFAFLESLDPAPAMLAGGLVVLAGLTTAATWILYKNLIVTPAVDPGYARVSH